MDQTKPGVAVREGGAGQGKGDGRSDWAVLFSGGWAQILAGAGLAAALLVLAGRRATPDRLALSVSLAALVVGLFGKGTGSPLGRAGKALGAAALCLGLWCLGRSLLVQGWGFIEGLTTPLAVNSIEGREAFKAWLLIQGRNIYEGLGSGGGLITLYGPGYYALAGLSQSLFGPGLPQARMVSLAAALALVAAVYALVLQETRNRPGALAAALTLACAPLMEYGHFARPDMLAWAFFFWAAWALLRALRSGRTGPAFWASLLLGLAAALTKQQTWPALGALGLYALLKGRVRLAVYFGLGMAVLCGAAFWWLDLATHGGFWAQNLEFPRRMAEITEMNSDASARERLRIYFSLNWREAVLIAAYALSALASRRLWVCEVLALCVLAPLYVVLRWTGAEYNHFLSVMVVAHLAAGALLARASAFPRVAASLAALVLALAVWPIGDLPSSLAKMSADTASRAIKRAELDRLAQRPGLVLSDAESAYVFLGGDLSRLRVYDAFETRIFERLGLFAAPDSSLGRGIVSREYALALVTPTFQPQGLISLLGLFYLPTATASGVTAFVPRPDTAVLAFDALSGPALGGVASGMGPAADAGASPATAREGAPRVQARIVSLENLDVEPGFVTADKRIGVGRLVVEIDSDADLASVGALFFPRIDQKSSDTVLELALDDARGSKTIWTLRGGQGRTGWTPQWDVLARTRADCSGRSVRLVFTLRGAAQLWFDPTHPLVVLADAARSAP
ncbi:hypothetical protein JCM15519_15690 [Fundidesulfovibrio butyratiphilus]